jgi:hypothetical protein
VIGRVSRCAALGAWSAKAVLERCTGWAKAATEMRVCVWGRQAGRRRQVVGVGVGGLHCMARGSLLAGEGGKLYWAARGGLR